MPARLARILARVGLVRALLPVGLVRRMLFGDSVEDSVEAAGCSMWRAAARRLPMRTFLGRGYLCLSAGLQIGWRASGQTTY